MTHPRAHTHTHRHAQQTYPSSKAHMNTINANMWIYAVNYMQILVASTAQSVLKHKSGTCLAYLATK